MGIEKGKRFSQGPIFVDYPFESVMFRWDEKRKVVYRKFYGETESPKPIPHDNGLFNDALLCGDEITAAQYHAGKPSSE
jgi:hypothetical protein